MKNIDILIKNGAVFDGTGAEPLRLISVLPEIR